MSGELTQAGARRAVIASVGGSQASVTMYIGLLTASSGSPDTDTLANYSASELTASGYTRQTIIWSDPTDNPAIVKNSASLMFGPFDEDPPEVGYLFMTDASSGTTGSVLAYWSACTPRDVGASQYLSITACGLTLSIT